MTCFEREDALALAAIEAGSGGFEWERAETARFALLAEPRDVVCPDCEGTGKGDFCGFQIPCGCCKGKGRATVKELRYCADFHEMMAHGGYVIDGDTWEERCAGLERAKRYTVCADALEAALSHAAKLGGAA